MNTEATIALSETIPLILSATDPKTGLPIAGATISDVTWTQDNPIGTIAPDPNNPSIGIFTPTKAGVTHITASAVVTIN